MSAPNKDPIKTAGPYPSRSIFSWQRFINLEDDLKRLLIIAIIVFAGMSLLNPGRFLTVRNFTSMGFQFPELGIFTMAIMLSLITGGIDLSIVSIANLAAILAALIMTSESLAGLNVGFLIAMAIIVGIATGLVCGSINGWLIGRVGITPILVTLGTLQLFMGIAFVITRGPAVSGFPDVFLKFGNGLIIGIPIPMLVFLSMALVTGVLLRNSHFGLYLYMLGTSITAARFSGINIKKMLFRTYLITGLYSGLTGLLMIARTNSAKADYGSSYLLQAVLVAILGGVNPNGGFGTVMGLIIAVLSLQFLSSGFNMLHLSNFVKEFTWGTFLLVIMVINYLGNQRRHNKK